MLIAALDINLSLLVLLPSQHGRQLGFMGSVIASDVCSDELCLGCVAGTQRSDSKRPSSQFLSCRGHGYFWVSRLGRGASETNMSGQGNQDTGRLPAV